MAYITVAELQRELGVLDDPVDELAMEGVIADAQDIIERTTHRRFEVTADETRTVDYNEETVNGRTLTLPWDLCQITSITNGDGTSITPSQYVTTPRLRSVSGSTVSLPAVPDAWPWYEIVLLHSSNVAWEYEIDREAAISITGRWGFSVTPPASVKRACARLAAWLYLQRDDLRDRAETAVSQEGVLMLMSDLPQDVQRRLMPFVRL
jgi:hypothetical protein